MLSADDLASFAQLGFLKLPAAIETAAIVDMRDRLWTEIRRLHGMKREDAETWTVLRPYGFQALSRRHAFALICTPVVSAALDDLLGEGSWRAPQRWGQPLVTFPAREGVWDVPHLSWHSDAPASEAGAAPGVNVFAYLDDVEPRGGGTVVVAGVQNLIARIAAERKTPLRSAEMREALAARNEWFASLLGKRESTDRVHEFMDAEKEIEGVRLRVVELTAAAGDVILMDLRMLHTAAPNHNRAPRLMVAQHIYRSR